MKEKIYTIPLNDAVNANDECPLCYVERNIEQDLLDYVLGYGASYMEADMRDMTDREGFCRDHFKKMFTYGNTLGNGWILKTHYMRIIEDMEKQLKAFTPEKTSFKDKFKKDKSTNPLAKWASEKKCSCYICNHSKERYDRYLDTFFFMWNNDPDFVERIKKSKGFCIPHFGELAAGGDTLIPNEKKEEFYDTLSSLMRENMNRLFEDVSWLVEKFDYQNKDADWKNSKDAIQRGMQKLKGGYPADPPYTSKK